MIPLTPKESEVAELISRGFTNKQIATALDITSGRVRVIVSAIAFKAHLDAAKDERVQVALWWVRSASYVETP